MEAHNLAIDKYYTKKKVFEIENKTFQSLYYEFIF